MNIENPVLLLLIIPFTFLLAFLAEALVLFFFRLKKFWAAFGISILVNLVSLGLIYLLASSFLSMLGYDTAQFNGLNLQPQVIAFLWWFSVMAEGLLLQLFMRHAAKKNIFMASILMNALSFIFLYGFVEATH